MVNFFLPPPYKKYMTYIFYSTSTFTYTDTDTSNARARERLGFGYGLVLFWLWFGFWGFCKCLIYRVEYFKVLERTILTDGSLSFF